ncbi:MAG: hypothetical protein AAGK74_01635 [Chloroflexota bacterium]
MSTSLTQLTRWLRRPTNVIALFVALLPPLLTFLMARAYWTRQVPHIDQWTLSQQIAMRTEAGTLTFGDLFIQNSVHRHVFSNVLTALLTLLNGWQLPATIYIVPVIALAQVAVTVLIFAKQRPQLTALALFPLALFVFFPTQYYVWLFTLSGSWIVAHTFMAGAVAIVSLARPSVAALLWTALLSLFGILTVSVIFPVWVVVPGVMLLRGYRDWRHYALWGVITVLAVGGYFLLPFPTNQRLEILFTSFSIENPTVSSVGDIVTGFFVYMSASVIFVDFRLAVVITLVGAGVFALNALYLWLTQTLTPSQLAPWLGFAAFTVGGGILLLVGRATSDIHPIDMAKQPRFFTVSIWFWRALFVLCLITGTALVAKRRRTLWQSGYLVLNAFVGVFIVLSITLTSVQTLFWYYGIYGHGLLNPPQHPNLETDLCVRDFALYRDPECLSNEFNAQQHSQPEFIYQLAVYRLVIFRDVLPENMLPEDAPVIVSTDSEWLALYVREFMLPDVPQLHLTAPAEWDDPAAFDPPLQNVVYDTDDIEVLRDFIGQHGEVWYLTIPEAAAYDEAVFEAADYTITPVEITAPRYTDAAFTLYRLVPQ